MIGVVVKVQCGESFEESNIRNIAETVRGKFEGMPGLHSKAFTFNSENREVTNFYIWDSEDAARDFFTKELVERIATIYGTSPTVEFVKIAALVENVPA